MTQKRKISPLRACEKILGHRFRSQKLLTLALTHRSYAHELSDSPGPDNERLEFLGDSILGFVIAELAYRRWPRSTEGDMTHLRSLVVSRKALAKRAAAIKLGLHMKLGKGQRKSGKVPETILSCGIEAVIGAIYLDGGLKAASRFIRNVIWPKRTSITRPAKSHTNYKEKIQHLFLKQHKLLPSYVVVSQSGPAHHRRFTMAVRLKNKTLARGEGLSKKEASQQAARMALKKLKLVKPRRRKKSKAGRGE